MVSMVSQGRDLRPQLSLSPPSNPSSCYLHQNLQGPNTLLPLEQIPQNRLVQGDRQDAKELFSLSLLKLPQAV